MNCEICGAVTDKNITVLIDNTQFDVCGKCSSLGTKIEVQDDRLFRKPVTKNIPVQNKVLEAEALIDGFGKKIMQARQKKNLTLKELAMKLYEKESVIQRIESEKFVPSAKTIKKLETELGINLRE